MSDITIDGVRDGDLAEILRNFERFWGNRDVRHLHHQDCGVGTPAFKPGRKTPLHLP
jgi:hypothetical protein